MLIMIILLSISVISVGAVGITTDGMGISKDGFIDSAGRTQVPVRAFAESLGCDVKWDGEAKLVTIEQEYTYYSVVDGSLTPNTVKNDISLLIGDNKVYKNKDNIIEMDTVAQIVDGSTYIPLRFVAEALDCTVSWDGENQMANITTYEYNNGYKAVGSFKVKNNNSVNSRVTYLDGSVVANFYIDYNGNVDAQKAELSGIFTQVFDKNVVDIVMNYVGGKVNTTESLGSVKVKDALNTNEIMIHDAGEVVAFKVLASRGE